MCVLFYFFLLEKFNLWMSPVSHLLISLSFGYRLWVREADSKKQACGRRDGVTTRGDEGRHRKGLTGLKRIKGMSGERRR